MATLTFDIPNQLIIVAAPDTLLDLQELWNKSQLFLTTLEAMSIPAFIFGSGKDDIGGGQFVGITVTLVDWKLQFEARAGPALEVMIVSGGNLVGRTGSLVGPVQHPIEPSANTHVTISQSTSPAAIAVETQRTRTFIEVTYDVNSATLTLGTWLQRSSDAIQATVTNPISTQVDWYRPDGSLLFSETSSSPDSNGHFWMSRSQNLSTNTGYYVVVTVTDATGMVTTDHGTPTIGAA